MTVQPADPSRAASVGASTDAPATALIAEDEPLLARALERQLAAQWPALRIVARAEDGPSAVERALAHRPDILFLDIQMPGATGLEAAAEIADEWEGGEGVAGAAAGPHAGPPLVVFVTAYDRYAVQAFERAAVDYLLKPVTPERLAETVARLRARLTQRAAAAAAPSAGADLLRQVQEVERQAQPAPAGGGEPDAAAAEERIRVIRAAEGTRVRMIPLPEVIAFEAADKYVNVVTEQGGDALIRMSLRELALRLEGVEFTQVHRGVLVNAERIVGAERDEAGHYWLTLRGLKRPLKVSRAFSHLFKPM